MSRIATPSKPRLRLSLLAGAALCLGLAGCSGMPKTNAPKENLAYPNFGTPAQIGTRPVMKPEEQQKMQSELESMGVNRASEMQQQIEQGGDLNTGQ